MDKTMQLYLKQDEADFLGLAVAGLMTLVKQQSNNAAIPWTPQVRKANREMLAAGTSLSIKLKKMGFDVEPLPPLEDGDIESFLTKES